MSQQENPSVGEISATYDDALLFTYLLLNEAAVWLPRLLNL